MKINTKKIYELIGRAVVYGSVYIGIVALFVYGFLQNTVY